MVYLVVLGQEQFAGNSGGVSRCRRYLRQFLATKPSRNGLGVVTCRQEMLTPAAFATTLTIPPIISFLVFALCLLCVCFVFALCLRLVAGFRPRKGERRGRDVPWTDGTIGFDQLGRGGVQRVGGGGV